MISGGYVRHMVNKTLGRDTDLDMCGWTGLAQSICLLYSRTEPLLHGNNQLFRERRRSGGDRL